MTLSLAQLILRNKSHQKSIMGILSTWLVEWDASASRSSVEDKEMGEDGERSLLGMAVASDRWGVCLSFHF